MSMNGQKCILVAEDTDNDFFLLQVAFERSGVAANLVHAWNGEQALQYLAGEHPFTDRNKHPLPDLLLLDLQMPCFDGFEVLSNLQSRSEPGTVPIVVLSSSSLQEDAQKAASLGARDFLTKPSSIKDYERMALGIQERWLGHAVPLVPKPKADANTPAPP